MAVDSQLDEILGGRRMQVRGGAGMRGCRIEPKSMNIESEVAVMSKKTKLVPLL